MEYSRKTKCYFLLNLIISVLFIFTVFINSIGYNLLTFNKKWAFELQFLFPQGWAFFTKDPRDEQTTLYKIKNKELFELNMKNGATNALFGISRRNRIMLIELAQVVNQIDTINWKAITSKEALLTFSDTAKAIEIVNFVNHSNLNGDYLIIKQKPLPWSWRENRDNLFMPAKVIKVKLIIL
jgi:antimicrobial peptide system SdpA family protein